MDKVAKLREAYRELKSAKKKVTTAHSHSTDQSVVFGTTGFALENIEKAIKAVEEVAKELKLGK